MANKQEYPTIVGIGSYLPVDTVTNKDLIKRTGISSSPEIIERLAGIKTRYFRGPEDHPSTMATAASKKALEVAGASKDSVHTLIVAADLPDQMIPSTAVDVHKQLGLPIDVYSYDIRAACAGGVMALHQAAGRVEEEGGLALAVSSNIISSGVMIPDGDGMYDRKTVILFGDAAGAAVVANRPDSERPVFAFKTKPTENGIGIYGGGSRLPLRREDDPNGRVVMDGKVVAKEGVPVMAELAVQVAQKADAWDDHRGKIDWNKIDFFIPHQANGRLVAALGDHLAVPSEKRVNTVEHYANTSGSTVFLALDHARREGRIPDNARLLFTSVGAGFVGASGIMNVNFSEANY